MKNAKCVIDWANLTDHKPKQEGLYMTAISWDGKPPVEYKFAYWVNKGGTLDLMAVTDKQIETWGDLADLFDRGKVEVEEDGFYVIYDLSEDSDEHPGYMQWYERLDDSADTMFWSDIPFAPDGYIDENEEQKRANASLMEKRLKEEEIRREIVLSETEEGSRGGIFYDAVENWLNTQYEDDAKTTLRLRKENGELNIRGYRFKDNQNEIRKSCYMSNMVEKTLEAVYQKYSKEEIEKDVNDKDKALTEGIVEIIKANTESKALVPSERILLCQLILDIVVAKAAPIESADEAVAYYAIGVIPKYPKYADLSSAQKYVVIVNMIQLENRAHRLLRLKELHAPDPIVKNERGLLFESIHYFFGKSTGEAEGFMTMYGLDKIEPEIEK